jgi:hypothetical protein
MKRQSATGWALALVLVMASMAQAQTPVVSPGQTALAAAARQQKYLFILFYKQDDAATQSVRQTLNTALAKRGDQASSVLVQTTDPTEKPLIDHWALSRSPMPLVLAVAPNGAVTGGFPIKLTEQDVARAFVSPGMAACLKATQSRKLVLLCVQPTGATELPVGVREFKADSQYGPATEIVRFQASDPAEAGFLQALQIKPAATTVIAFLAPPGNLLGTFESTVTKQQLVDRLKSAQSSCCPGGKCGPGGCCPGGKCEPRQ